MAGPLLTLAANRLSVRYDYDEDDGAVVWAELCFDDVLGVTYKDSAAYGEDDVLGSDYVVEEHSGTELNELVNRWLTSVGWQEFERKKEPFKSYRVFFDDAASLLLLRVRYLLVSLQPEPLSRLERDSSEVARREAQPTWLGFVFRCR